MCVWSSYIALVVLNANLFHLFLSICNKEKQIRTQAKNYIYSEKEKNDSALTQTYHFYLKFNINKQKKQRI